jgi:glycosyltransferase involved in cell wall biosynthesis
MRVLVATDAWHPQINGVVRSLEYMAAEAPAFGAHLSFLTPEGFRTVPLPTYAEIRLALIGRRAAARAIREADPDHIHIATEGPIGFAARAACVREGRAFTTAYHTRYPEYVTARVPIPESWPYWIVRRFHARSAGILVATPSLERELAARGFRRLLRWTRGVDTDLFRPRERSLDLPRPVFLFVGRVAVEKNLEAFLRLDLPGTKVVVGDGPARPAFEAAHPAARFLGVLEGEALARAYASADAFVFPSLTDTFGMVLLEALAAGTPVAGFPVTGPMDVLGDSGCGVLDADLRRAALAALDIPRGRCRDYALGFSWRESARQFFAHVASADGRPSGRAPVYA